MAAKKVTKEPVPLKPDITVDAAFQMLVKHCGVQYPDRVLDAAFAKGDPAQGGLPLWEGNYLVPPQFFATELGVWVKVDGVTGRPHAEIVATRWALDPGSGPGGSHVWRTSAAAVSSLIKNMAAIDGDQKSEGRKRGRKVKFEWDTVFSEFLRHVHDKGIPDDISAEANRLNKWCLDNFKANDEIPSSGTLRKKISIWLGRIKPVHVGRIKP